MKPAGLVTEAWSYRPNSGTERIEYDLLNLCFRAVEDCLIRSGTRTTELCGTSLSLKVSGAVHLVTVGQRSLKGVRKRPDRCAKPAGPLRPCRISTRARSRVHSGRLLE